MRIISGTLRGRQLKGYEIVGTRPTMDRVKESIFGMIQEDLRDAVVLDLFAGSGNLGLEALSNGSKECYFIDHNPVATKLILGYCDEFRISNQTHIYTMDYQTALQVFADKRISFDLVFLDPPYQSQILVSILETLSKNGLLKDEAVIVVEMEENDIGSAPIEGLILEKSRDYGSKKVNVYRKEETLI